MNQQLSSKDAEQWVIGSIIVEPDSIEKIPCIRHTDFGYPKHQLIFKTINDMRKNGTPISLETIKAKLRDKVKETDWIGIDDVPTSETVTYWANQVKIASTRRKLHATLHNASQDLDREPPETIMARIKEELG
nr:hypothetical protein [Candidatus Aenigmarchaeota archaeon]